MNYENGFAVPIIISILAILAIGGGLLIYKNKNITQYIGAKLGACTIEENRGDTVSPDIAKAVALNQVINNNKPYNWVSVGYYPIYGSSGLVNYYAFVFRKSEFTKFTTLNSLEQNASNYSDKSSDDDNKYQFNDIASVLTGTAEGDALIIRHYIGIPEIIAKKIEIKKFVENKDRDKTIGNIISDSPMGKAYYEIISKSNNKVTDEVIGLDYLIVSKNELANYQTEVKDRANKRYLSFDQKECEKYKQAIVEREKDLKNQWEKYNQ
ncbi:hypothetical protein A2643_02225 [Candidatus Nomurabacteria bacterium RIFCSPHIGHO2_01_FULL_39_220]|uniref:Uncharacterized protein n=1 Tax=Candidatus Nomurabacteria bacterium RIFCSPLOWO2_02_FULL_40_67 TaxID=1801787 RepID=A0A1F6Y2J5_9BACT|nr:MAG: hypothetical protein UU01_C0020G0028 [Parcubacteria group bacterium GW2011_GWA2_40_37]KKS11366.1 MAG: hypothetical protein UU66_C0019G0001 [Parcubacteria group bacterium GW2011_GWB1_41_5]OGI63062.1 MAG: hypothetical protein A2W12_01335 [Candidatus Nomurabacteria bacterium RBG_16_40_11]OGI70975.1 MAG: hypothetical protein A2643_02225 [Candidatus Nomurabacteria bacterium RIFCSPHIGHO2_01_FULL_39_220]OGI72700.1 MAG: hypothetical protein A2W56_02610 [Candidatus Nomurabacteria bacterium RIFCS